MADSHFQLFMMSSMFVGNYSGPSNVIFFARKISFVGNTI